MRLIPIVLWVLALECQAQTATPRADCGTEIDQDDVLLVDLRPFKAQPRAESAAFFAAQVNDRPFDLNPAETLTIPLMSVRRPAESPLEAIQRLVAERGCTLVVVADIYVPDADAELSSTPTFRTAAQAATAGVRQSVATVITGTIE